MADTEAGSCRSSVGLSTRTCLLSVSRGCLPSPGSPVSGERTTQQQEKSSSRVSFVSRKLELMILVSTTNLYILLVALQLKVGLTELSGTEVD